MISDIIGWFGVVIGGFILIALFLTMLGEFLDEIRSFTFSDLKEATVFMVVGTTFVAFVVWAFHHTF